MPQEMKIEVKDYVKLGPLGRLRKLKWWFILLLILVLIFGIWVVVVETGRIYRGSHASSYLTDPPPSVSAFSAIAFMQAGSAIDASQRPKQDGGKKNDPMRPYIMVGILSLIAVITLVCLGVSLFSPKPTAVTTASDLLKTCIGFFIGIATSYFGGP